MFWDISSSSCHLPDEDQNAQLPKRSENGKKDGDNIPHVIVKIMKIPHRRKSGKKK